MINTREAGDANLRSVTLHQMVAEYAHSIFWWMLHIISNLNTLFFAGSIFDITFAASWYSTWNLLQVEIADRSCSSDTVAELGQYSHPCRYQRMQYPNSTSLTIPTVFTQYHLPASTCQLPYYWTPCLWSSYGSPLRFLHNTQSHSQLISFNSDWASVYQEKHKTKYSLNMTHLGLFGLAPDISICNWSGSS